MAEKKLPLSDLKGKILGDGKEDGLPKALPETEEAEEEWLAESEGQLTVDVFQTSSDIIIQAPIAGVKPEDVDISITDDVITIKGERKEENSIDKENYYVQECYWGAFSRSIILPVPVLMEKAKATFKNGVLTISLPKAERAKTKSIKVKALQ